MKRLLLIAPLALLASGCTVITYNRVFPKLAFAWSQEAIQQRADERAYKRWNPPTNSPAR